MKSLKSNEIYHNVVDLTGWGRFALHEDTLQRIQLSDLAYILTIPFGYHINSES
jgi:hypothetical protein